ncbi:hypothetical protein l11_10730 [Neisseria weaveri LMG 5135]|nr:hypothetical protein l11_10730 [Neisseria weaveri LMG 5135]
MAKTYFQTALTFMIRTAKMYALFSVYRYAYFPYSRDR